MAKIVQNHLELAKKPAGIMFHHFHGGSHKKSQGSISCKELEAIITAIPRERIISAKEWMLKAEAEKFNGDEICLTFDDSLRCQFDVALGVLEQFEITAFWFLYTSIYEGVQERLEIYRRFRHECFASIEQFYEFFFSNLQHFGVANIYNKKIKSFDPNKYLNHCTYLSANDKKFRYVRDEILTRKCFTGFMDELISRKGRSIQELAQGLWLTNDQIRYLADREHEIGMHTHTHPTKLSLLSPKDQKIEFYNNRRVLRKLTGHSPRSVSYPNNSFNEDTVSVLHSMGTNVGFCASENVAEHNNLQFPRYNHVHLLHRLRSVT